MRQEKLVFWALLVIGLFGPAFIEAAPLHPTRALEPGRWASQAGFSFFNTSANFDTQWGSFERLPDSNSYQNYLFDYRGQYELNQFWALKTYLGLAVAESFDGIYSRSNSSLTEVGLGTSLAWFISRFQVFPEFWFYYPLNRVDPLTDAVLTGEGAMTLDTNLWLRWDLANWLQPFARIGWSYRDEGRSSLLHWDLGTHLYLNHWIYRLQLQGYNSTTDDAYLLNPEFRDNVTTAVNGGSFRFFSINPSLLEFQAKVDYALSPEVFVGVGGAYTLDGQNSAQGYTLFVTAAVDVQLGKVAKPQPQRERRRQEVERFRVDTRDYDEQLFRERPSPEVEEQMRREERLRQQRRRQLEEQRRRLQRPTQPSDEEIDQLLQETEERLR